jgi:hypothetical protein
MVPYRPPRFACSVTKMANIYEGVIWRFEWLRILTSEVVSEVVPEVGGTYPIFGCSGARVSQGFLPVQGLVLFGPEATL